MKQRIAVVAVVVIALAVGLAAQGKTDFAGTWKRDATKSDAPQMGRGGPGGGGPGGGGMMGDVTMTVTQTASELAIDRKMGETSQKSVYKLDGSESVNPGMRGGDVKSKAKWDGANLVIESTQTMSTQMGDMTINTKDVWQIGTDGTLTVVTTRSTPQGERTTKTVYAKVTS